MYREGKVLLKVILSIFKLYNWIFYIYLIKIKNYFLDNTDSISSDNKVFYIII